ncbi:MAG: DNA replication/repair protein RecF [Firmicutes bacterium]|nr:DNA replication/repair protein RecF [Bacillota bacterium]
MNIEFIYLKNFRNYEELSIKLNPGINIIFGENAQGKTNILESIYLLSMGKSYRTQKYNEMIKWDKEKCKVYIEYNKKDIEGNIEFFIAKNKKKQIKINGVNVEKVSDILGRINTVMFSPEHIKIIKEGPVERRRFIDAILSQVKPSYYYNLIQYLKVLGQRNVLLSDEKRKNELGKTLDIWDNQLIEYGSKVIKERYIFINNISKTASSINDKLSGGKENLVLKYKPSVNIHDYSSDNIKKSYESIITKGRAKDIKRGITNWGPHRDELIFSIGEKELRNFGSQGQQRSALLSLKLAETIFIKDETGTTPVLLLDDVFSELDNARRGYLLEYIKDIQVILTCTDLNNMILKNIKNPSLFHVKNAVVSRVFNE